MKLSKEQLRIASVSLAVRMDNHNDIDSVIEHSEVILKWVTK